MKTVIIILGPTAVGKTSAAIKLAEHFQTEIISADSSQCFKELNIGVAKPTPHELNAVKHYFINSHSIHDTVTAQVFEEYALNAAEEIFKENNTAIMVGGTGMYIKAFCEGLDEIPQIDIAVRDNLMYQYKEKGLKWLQQQVEEKDPEFWKQAEQKNPQRLMRALEVFLSTGKSILAFRKNKKKERSFAIKKIGIDLPKEQLHLYIEKRVDKMVGDGLVDEVKSLLPYEHLNALQTVGYREIFDHLHDRITLEKAIEKIKINTKRYAKRQLTWFKKDSSIQWLQHDEKMI